MNTNETSNKYFLPAAVILAGIFIAGAVIWNGSHPSAGSGQAPTPTAPKVDIKNVKTDGDPFIGDVNAPVTIAFWSDFQCPIAKLLKSEVFLNHDAGRTSTNYKNYVDTGKVKIVFMDYVFLGNNSVTAAL